MTVSDNTVAAEILWDFFKSLGKKDLLRQKRCQEVFLKGRALQIGANFGSVFPSRDLETVLSSLPGLVNFYHLGKGLYLGKNV